MSRGRFVSDISLIIRRGQMNDCEYIDLDYCDIDTSDFVKEVSIINENYKSKNEQTEEMRKFTFLDEVRSIE